MKRLVRSKSWKEMFVPKWQNIESKSCEIGDYATRYFSSSLKTSKSARVSDAWSAPTAVTESNDAVVIVDSEDQTQKISEGMRIKRSLSNSQESMYRATVEGDCVAAVMLLEEFPNLASEEISEERERSLHLAVALKHKKLVEILVERMSPSELELVDGRGYTACCYAAISGVVDIADLIIKKNPTLATARDREKKTPLYKAAFRGNAAMVLYFLKITKFEDLPKEEWFELLIVAICRKMYGVALEISKINEQLSTMRNDQGTALHHLARQRFIEINDIPWFPGVEQPYVRSLAKNLWENVQRLGKASAVELMKNPPILHDAASVGNVELITMLTRTYPNLVWHIDKNGYTLFHIAVIYRHENLFTLMNEIGATKDIIALSQDENGNNILHLAAKLGPLDWRVFPIPPYKMQWEMLWFRKVKEIVPPVCVEMKNKEGDTPGELFGKEHASLRRESRTWLRNTSDTSMLISTLILSALVASAFAVPGGYNQETGVPILLKASWFTYFVMFDVLAMLFSVLSITIFFLSTMMSSLNQECYAEYIPNAYICGVMAQVFSAVLGTSAYLSAYFLVYSGTRPPLVMKSVVVFTYVVFVPLVCLVFGLFLLVAHPRRVIRMQTRHTLFNPL